MDKKEALEVLKKSIEECEMKCEGPHLVVLDRGWIFQGNLIPPEKEDGLYTLTNCVNVRKWNQGGFGGLSLGAQVAGATLDSCATITFKKTAMIFACPTGDDWRLK